MQLRHIIYKNVTAILLAVTFFACKGNYKEIQQLTTSDLGPVAEGKDVDLKYTDSGKLVANLMTPKLWDYSNYNFSFSEFPEGLEVHFWNEAGDLSIVTSDYGIRYDKTALIDLRGNVVLIMSDSTELNAAQLYWDQENKWLFTDRPYKIKFKDGSFNDGELGFDSSEDFNTFLSRKNTGVQIVEDKTENNE